MTNNNDDLESLLDEAMASLLDSKKGKDSNDASQEDSSGKDPASRGSQQPAKSRQHKDTLRLSERSNEVDAKKPSPPTDAEQPKPSATSSEQEEKTSGKDAEKQRGLREMDEDDIDRFVDEAFLEMAGDEEEAEPAPVEPEEPADEFRSADTVEAPADKDPVTRRRQAPPAPAARQSPPKPEPKPEPQPEVKPEPKSPPEPEPQPEPVTARPSPSEPAKKKATDLDIPVEPDAVRYIDESETEGMGIRFGKYLLLERVAVGGMAEIFKAKQLGLEGFEKLVAIKRILPHLSDNQEFVEMFIDEAKVAAQLTHQNICQIYELGEHEGAYFLAMEFIYGKDLKTMMNRAQDIGNPVSPHHAALIISKLCAGLDYAHRKKDLSGNDLNIVHRDISPQNILVSYEGEVKLIDFGIAKAASKASVTRKGALKGKILYMSPEQAQGLPIDNRSDIFSLGTLLSEILTGRRLFMAKNEHAILMKVREAKAVPPSSFRDSVPADLDRIVMKALQKDPDDRYQSASEMQRDLDLYLLQSTDRTPASYDLASYMHELFGQEIQKEIARGYNDPAGELEDVAVQKPSASKSPEEKSPSPVRPPEDDDTQAGEVIPLMSDSEINDDVSLETAPGIESSSSLSRLVENLLNPFTIAFILFVIVVIVILLAGGSQPSNQSPASDSDRPAVETTDRPDSPVDDIPSGAPADDDTEPSAPDGE